MVGALLARHSVVQAFVLRLRSEHVFHLGRHDTHIERYGFQFGAAAVQSAHVEHIIDEREQIR